MPHQAIPVTPPLRFLAAADAVLHVLAGIPTLHAASSVIAIFQSILASQQQMLIQRPAHALNPSFFLFVADTSAKLARWAEVLPELGAHPVYRSFLLQKQELQELMAPLRATEGNQEQQ